MWNVGSSWRRLVVMLTPASPDVTERRPEYYAVEIRMTRGRAKWTEALARCLYPQVLASTRRSERGRERGASVGCSKTKGSG